MGLWIRDKFYDGNSFNRLLLACRKIGVMKIDPEPFRWGVQRGWNSAKYTKNTLKKLYLWKILIRDNIYDGN